VWTGLSLALRRFAAWRGRRQRELEGVGTGATAPTSTAR